MKEGSKENKGNRGRKIEGNKRKDEKRTGRTK
jgi:hypothetical protein